MTEARTAAEIQRGMDVAHGAQMMLLHLFGEVIRHAREAASRNANDAEVDAIVGVLPVMLRADPFEMPGAKDGPAEERR